VARIILAARAREARREATQQVLRKTPISHRLNLPGKLADCCVHRPRGERALHRRGRQRRRLRQAGARSTHAGDPPAARQGAQRRAGVDVEGALQQGAADIVSALGCGFGKDFDASKLRYGGLPADGRRQRRAPHRDAAAHVLLPAPARPAARAATSTSRSRRSIASTRARRPLGARRKERDRILAKLREEREAEISRFKGLGEMPAEDLKATTLDPRQARALRVVIEDELETDRVMNELMGKDAQARFRFITERAALAELDV
jgi:DNA gyrase subunit B